MKRVDQLTFTRFLCLLAVIFYHDGGGIYLKPFEFFPLLPILRSAPSWVSYLYVLSGFVMVLVYYRPEEKFKIGEYWKARFARIYPLYLLSFLLTCLYYYDFITRIKAAKILSNIFLVQAWFPQYAQSFNVASWSLSVEALFYFLFPFITIWAYRQSTRKLIALSMILWVVTQVVHYTLWNLFMPDWQNTLIYFPPFHLSSFFLGIAGGIWFVRETPKINVDPRANLFVLFGSIAFTWTIFILGSLFPSFPRGLQLMEGLLAPAFLLIILSLAVDKTKLSRALSHPWLLLLGETAYALYILHIPVRWLYERLLQTLNPSQASVILDSTFLPLMIIIGVGVHLYVDQPIRKWLRDLLGRVNVLLLLLDIAAVFASVGLSFLLRFGTGKDLEYYAPGAYLLFWCAFVLRIILSISFDIANPAVVLTGTIKNIIRNTFVAITTGSVALFAILSVAVFLGWLEGFPRTIFLFDWALMMALTLISRFAFRQVLKSGRSPSLPQYCL